MLPARNGSLGGPHMMSDSTNTPSGSNAAVAGAPSPYAQHPQPCTAVQQSQTPPVIDRQRPNMILTGETSGALQALLQPGSCAADYWTQPHHHHHQQQHNAYINGMSYGGPAKPWMGPLSLKSPPLPSTFNPSTAYANAAKVSNGSNGLDSNGTSPFGGLAAAGLLTSTGSGSVAYSRATGGWQSPPSAPQQQRQSHQPSWLHSPQQPHVPNPALQSFVSPRGTSSSGSNGLLTTNTDFWSPPQSSTIQSVLDLPPVPVSSSAAQEQQQRLARALAVQPLSVATSSSNVNGQHVSPFNQSDERANTDSSSSAAQTNASSIHDHHEDHLTNDSDNEHDCHSKGSDGSSPINVEDDLPATKPSAVEPAAPEQTTGEQQQQQQPSVAVSEPTEPQPSTAAADSTDTAAAQPNTATAAGSQTAVVTTSEAEQQQQQPQQTKAEPMEVDTTTTSSSSGLIQPMMSSQSLQPMMESVITSTNEQQARGEMSRSASLAALAETVSNVVEQNRVMALKLEDRIRQESQSPSDLTATPNSTSCDTAASTPPSVPLKVSTQPPPPAGINFNPLSMVTSSAALSMVTSASFTSSFVQDMLRSASQSSLNRPPGLHPPAFTSPTSVTSTETPAGLLFPANSTAQANASSTPGGPTVYTCPICAFSSASKFHFNSHMNTHTDHQCSMCDYTSRTEGRLKRHMKESHSLEEQREAGIQPDGTVAPAAPSSSAGASVDTPDTSSMMDTSHMDDLSALEHMQALANRSEASMLPTSITEEAIRASQERNTASVTSTPPKRTQSSKPKHYKCKQCGHVSNTKEESWAHARSHIPAEKQLTCPRCDFVTEYKHHLEYHLRNHFGSKPFQCTKCKYTCVNKSMLNSHMKSHSNFYQYRCADCTYATKYCHSLKLHLRKYGHRPTTVINQDGQHVDPQTISGLNSFFNPSSASANASRAVTPRGSEADSGMGNGMGDDQEPPPSMAFLQQSNGDHQGLLSRTAPLSAQLPLISAGLLAQQKNQLEAAGLMQRMLSLQQHQQHQQQQQQQQHHRLPPGLAGLPGFSNLPGAGFPGIHQSHESAFTAPNKLQLGSLSTGQSGQSPFLPLGLATSRAPPALPTSNGGSDAALRPLGSGGLPQAGNSPAKCTMCSRDFVSKEELIKHHIQTHMTDLAQLCTLRRQHNADMNAAAAGKQDASSAPPHSNGQQHHQPQQQQQADRPTATASADMDTMGGRYSEEAAEASPITGGSQASSGSPKVSSDECSSGSGSGRRKGKAFKLDEITRRLHCRQSPSHSASGSTKSEEHEEVHSDTTGDGAHGGQPQQRRESIDSQSSLIEKVRAASERGDADQQQQQQREAVAAVATEPAAREQSPNSKAAQYIAALRAAALLRQKHDINGDIKGGFAPFGGLSNGGTAGNWSCVCEHCRMAFEDPVLYHIHMGYHGYEHPFKCNRCGQHNDDALMYNLHLMQAKHE